MTAGSARGFRLIAVFGVAVGVVFGLATWIFLRDLDHDLDRSLAIGESASGSVIETIDVAERLIESLDAGLGTVAATLEAVESALSDTAGVASSTASLSASLPESFADIDAALSTVESLSGAIDVALTGLSSVPFGPDYDPDVPLPVAVGNLRSAFAPIGEDLAAIAVELQAFADGSDDVGVRVDAVRADLTETRAALSESAGLLDDYRRTATEAGLLAASSRDEMGRAFLVARVAALLVALLIVVSQYVPWSLASGLSTERVSSVTTSGNRTSG